MGAAACVCFCGLGLFGSFKHKGRNENKSNFLRIPINLCEKHMENKFSPKRISSAHYQLDTDPKHMKGNVKCYSRGLLSEWEHFYNSQRSLSFTSNCSYSQLLRYIYQNVT